MSLPGPPAQVNRVVYLGTPEVGVKPLRELHAAGISVSLVVSRPDKRRGRGSTLTPSPVKAAAIELGLPVSDELQDATTVGADLAVVVAYGRIIPTDLLAQLPMVNLHFSLLPRWRGAAPVERAILAGDAQTGVCLMAVEPELDTGGIYDREVADIGADETLTALRSRLVDLGAAMVVKAITNGFEPAVAQVGEPTYAHKITPQERQIDWSKAAIDIHRQVRVGDAWTTFRGKRLKVHRSAVVSRQPGPVGTIDGTTVACESGGLELIEVQPEGKPILAASAWRNGYQPAATDRMGQ